MRNHAYQRLKLHDLDVAVKRSSLKIVSLDLISRNLRCGCSRRKNCIFWEILDGTRWEAVEPCMSVPFNHTLSGMT